MKGALPIVAAMGVLGLLALVAGDAAAESTKPSGGGTKPSGGGTKPSGGKGQPAGGDEPPKDWAKLPDKLYDRALEAEGVLLNCENSERRWVDYHVQAFTEAINSSDNEIEWEGMLQQFEFNAARICEAWTAGYSTDKPKPGIPADAWEDWLKSPFLWVSATSQTWNELRGLIQARSTDLIQFYELRTNLLGAGEPEDPEIEEYLGKLLLSIANSICNLGANEGNLAYINAVDYIYEATATKWPAAASRFASCAATLADKVYEMRAAQGR